MPGCLPVPGCLLRSTIPASSAAIHGADSSYSASVFRKRRPTKCLRAGTSSGTGKSLAGVRRYHSDVAEHRDVEVPSRRHQTLTLLHKTASLLPRALPTTDGSDSIESSRFWEDVLTSAGSELSSRAAPDACLRIAVCGVDEWSGSRDLITALLEDPFTSDETYSDIVRNRWKNHPHSIVIEHGSSTALANHSEEARLSVPSPWLQHFSFPVQLCEYPALSSGSGRYSHKLVDGDVLVLLWNALTTPLPALVASVGHLLRRPNTFLVISPSTSSDHLLTHVAKTLSDTGIKPGKILSIDPARALSGLSSLKSNPTSPTAVLKYQDDFLGSQLSTLSQSLAEYFGAGGSDNASLARLRTQTALAQIRSALEAGSASVARAHGAINVVCEGARELRRRVEELRARVELEVLGASGDTGRVEKALKDGTKEMQILLDSLSWWKMLWRVDEVGVMVGGALDKHWCKELESQLMMQTGRLSSEQQVLASSTFAFLSTLVPPSPSSAFHSPLLVNQLQQLTSSPTYALTPTSLIKPIHSRRAQLIEHTTTRLHRNAQSAVLGTFGGVFGGAGVGWWLTFGEGFVALGTGAGAESAVGVGMLVAVGGMRWAVGKWEKAKRRWMQDLERVGDGSSLRFTFAVQANLQRIVDDNVTVVPVTACGRLHELITKRQEEVDQIKDDLNALEAELDTLNGHNS
ncbi:hypothetical protein BV22DRAFT_1064712 [Leucogyrophana mollusca]|uniref:Uncharacterized protein n=1 Tax=Leucogyrophana mollusca TaxID=85980 RepID=A0ACB8BIJ0_9AGAM|nr:hypothetical protein BV22DRAFT_1064712 [Leucogyrophana mollusca]